MTKIFSTLGFLFSSDLQKVALITKRRPTFHEGKLNGLGGKIEQGETAVECIVREVKEETGIVTNQSDWVSVGSLAWDTWYVEIFTAVLTKNISILKNTGEEEVGWYEVDDLPENVLTNLPWLIPMCVDRLKNGNEFIIEVIYKDTSE